MYSLDTNRRNDYYDSLLLQCAVTKIWTKTRFSVMMVSAYLFSKN